MALRAPAVPLITVDPYFSIWSPFDRLYDGRIVHWTGSSNTLDGFVTVDGEAFRFMGDEWDVPAIEQTSVRTEALVTDYVFENKSIILRLSFYTPLFADDLYHMSRPVSYLDISYESADGKKHDVSVSLRASEELCINKRGEKEVEAEAVAFAGGINAVKMGSKEQKILNRSGDDVRIDWGYFYLAAPDEAKVFAENYNDMLFARAELALWENDVCTVLFAYDDIKSIEYFGKHLDSFWKKNGQTIGGAIAEAYAERKAILARCREFSAKLYADALEAANDEYAELLSLAYRQVIAAHKLVVDENGENLFISKECFSNGCAATVDVTYPSAPMFLLYNTELLKGMLRPVFRYAESGDWEFDFAPHDVGQYPLVNGEVYARNRDYAHFVKHQMPVEECGNMLILAANICKVDGNTEFTDKYMPTLEKWVKYLIEYGADPADQLCTDDFAGHLAHNCNLSLKAIMGIEGWSAILAMKGDKEAAEKYDKAARDMAAGWLKNADNGDGSFRLAFDRKDSFSMKYNMVWDKLWNTGIFPVYAVYSELASNKKHFNYYGMPLDNRKNYTKSDWLVWTATLAPSREEFCEYIHPLYSAYDVSLSRVPMTDWYDTRTAQMIGFRHRTVQGGLFIKLLEGKLG